MRKICDFIKELIGFILGIFIMIISFICMAYELVIDGLKLIITILMFPYIFIYTHVKSTIAEFKK